jgi:hypothetical protein
VGVNSNWVIGQFGLFFSFLLISRIAPWLTLTAWSSALTRVSLLFFPFSFVFLFLPFLFFLSLSFSPTRSFRTESGGENGAEEDWAPWVRS